MTFEELQRANETLSTMDIKGKNYVLVNERVKAFRMLYPDGCILTEILSNQDGIVLMQANVYDAQHNLLSVGHAYEKESSTYINKTSYIENCETSAVGRALGFLGIGVDTSIASYEEVQNAVNNQEKKPDKYAKYKTNKISEDEAEQLEAELAKANVNIPALLKKEKVETIYELTPEQMVKIYGQLDDYQRNKKPNNNKDAVAT